ncbi:related to Probable nucleolar complex protein 14 [Saccharomycodes ludwigii]|uniref:Related to Probable nucleolar complex protein 14 n=1 Tax=Saccharomycodes ludwigii TaxID=36035 RepID=A0A376B7B0_9ASCO|nr:hypothetical protein SCDLUD_000255 [Saccharomycodes ludwigii]KAH3902672.1 hypothetical protein SCDLUD_000255 [Saccharomycodes ludwigii]SSD60532.1 related to Probable nucleolar complex protein 14 [Saccharomycodes ludwigii]
MAGSQLKNLKEALKAKGLTGSDASKKNNRKKRQAKDYDREEREKVIAQIRQQFNPFDFKTNKNKRNLDKDDKVIQVGKPGISKQIGEEQRANAYESKKLIKNKNGSFRDKRFGERNKYLTDEEKMLERFKKERQVQSSKRSLFDIEDDENDTDTDIYGTNLTHYGKALSFKDDFGNGDSEVDSSEDTNEVDGFKKVTRKRHEEPFNIDAEEEPKRKKTKAEVMQEVIAKSKFYKHERQAKHEQMLEKVEDLDEDFESIMSELRKTNRNPPKESGLDTPGFKDYDMKVRELVGEKRATPADRTKTEEELTKERKDKLNELEQNRINRMNGIFGLEDEEKNGDGVEDLDGEGFWGDSDYNDDYIYGANIPNSEDDVSLSDAEEFTSVSEKKTELVPSLPCPQTHDELLHFLEKYPSTEHVSLIKKIIRTYQPKLAEGNKEKLNTFVGVIFRHIIFLNNVDYSSYVEEFKATQNSLIAILKIMSEKYNMGLSVMCREYIKELQLRFKKHSFKSLAPGDLIFFVVIGFIFSTSDHYHLVVTPANILIGEFLEQIKIDSFQSLLYCAILSSISLQYQRYSKRFVPEIVYFLEKALITMLPVTKDVKKDHFETLKINTYDVVIPTNIRNVETIPPLQLHSLFSKKFDDDEKSNVFFNILAILDQFISTVWKNLSAFQEIILPIEKILKEYELLSPELLLVKNINEKIAKLVKFNVHLPLTLQDHKPMAIPTYAPKFEENFNPAKKSYDPDMTRNEINKMKAQLKKERKFTMKEIRKDTKFEARKRIEEKKTEYADYHGKMARIVNTINTVEGAEKNKYEREKSLRSGKK